jgi:hypothetical protein
LQSRLDFVKLALENLKQGISVHTSIVFIRRMLRSFPLDNVSNQKFTGMQV